MYEESSGPVASVIRDAMEWLQGNIQPATVIINERSYIRTARGGYEEVETDPLVSPALRNRQGDALKLGTCESLIAFLNDKKIRVNWSCPFRVVVNRDGIVAYMTEAEAQIPLSGVASEMDYVLVPLITPWDRRRFTFDQLKEFFDIHTGKIQGEEDLRASIKTLTLGKREQIKLEDKGAFTVVSLAAGKDLEGQQAQIPKEITITLPTGTREFEIDQRFLFRVYLDGPSFELIHIENDGSWEMLLSEIMKTLKAGLPNDLIVEGV